MNRPRGPASGRHHLAAPLVAVWLLASSPAGAEIQALGKVPPPDWLVDGDRDRPLAPGDLAFGWHGTAAIEVRTASGSVLFDPFYSRYSAWELASGPIAPAPELLDRYVRRPDAVFVNHMHFDHCLDAPAIARKYGIPLYLPEDGIAIARAEGVPEVLIRPVGGGERIWAGDMEVEVLRSRHPEVATQWLVGGKMPATFQLPMRYSDYKTDEGLNFVLRHGERVLAHLDAPDFLDGPAMQGSADVVLVSIGVWYRRPQIFARIARAFDPAVLVPMHHDDFTRPLSEPALENPFSSSRNALPDIERDLPRTAVVPFAGFFSEYRIAGDQLVPAPGLALRAAPRGWSRSGRPARFGARSRAGS